MIEANIRIIYPGMNLFVRTRKARISGTNITPDIIERVCGRLLYQGVSAIPDPQHSDYLIIAQTIPIQEIKLEGSDWSIKVTDSKQPITELRLTNPNDIETIRSLMERKVYASIATQTDMWTLDGHGIWYEATPSESHNQIDVYRRFEIGAEPIDTIGMGIVIDVGTVFFHSQSLAYFFDINQSEPEKQKRQDEFKRLSLRQKGKLGTLMYERNGLRMTCYFRDAGDDTTCSTTGIIRTDNKEYESLYHYYQIEYPRLGILPDDRAVRVSFRKKQNPVWVAAKLVRPRIMNEALPTNMRNMDKLHPEIRRPLIENLWKKLGRFPFGKGMPGLYSGFWQPPQHMLEQFTLPQFTYGKKAIQESPILGSESHYRKHYRDRVDMLWENGCYYVPMTVSRNIHFAYPDTLDDDKVKRFANSMARMLSDCTKLEITVASLIPYTSIRDAVTTLHGETAELVVFIMNEEPTAYHEVAYNQDWRVKRITQNVFRRKYQNERDKRRQERFVTTNGLSVLQLMEAIPYTTENFGQYQAQLVIDVGHDRRQFALSLNVIAERRMPKFSGNTEVYEKGDHQHDTINPAILKDFICELFHNTIVHTPEPLKSLLVIRDGEFRNRDEGKVDEVRGVNDAINALIKQGYISKDAMIHLVDYRKSTSKTIRLWEVDDDGNVINPLEGIALYINRKKAVLTTTGRTTLTQGTASPVTITGNGQCPDINMPTGSIFVSSQLNWTSPQIAQSHPLGVTDADEELKARQAQEIKQPR